VLYDGSDSPKTRSSARKADKCHGWKENEESGEQFANERGPTYGWSAALRVGSKLDWGAGAGSPGQCPTSSRTLVYKEGG